jgi:endonuclease YncB( thermonuclease family)
MKSTLIVILFFVLAVLLSQFNLALKDNSLIVRYVQPFFYETLESELDIVRSDEVSASADNNGNDELNQDLEIAELRQVIDGDTIDVFINGEVERIRYIGANTPEFGEACYQQSSLANRRLVEGYELTLERDETDRDPNGRLLRYVYANGLLVERQLIAEGFAEAVRYRSDDNFYEEFVALEEAAAEQGLGCHRTGIFDDGSLVR